ncbi:MAG TPA: glycosyltransferase family 2 protein [Acidimicrobiales bacterium]|nr:glycosyltransferase family 2 protein [Acidimicrobiales bacterium]
MSDGQEAPAATDHHRTLSVIVPVYNERNTVGEVVRRMRRVDLPLDLEILVVDDGSDDGTDRILAAIEDSTVHVVRHDVNRGKGAAVRTALARARGDIILIQDADLEYDPSQWPRLLDPVLGGRAAVVYGSRFSGEGMSASVPEWAANRFLSLVTNVLYNTTLSDLLTGYKVFDRRVLDGLSLDSDRFEFESEFTAKVLRRGHGIYEVPVGYARRDRKEGRKYAWTDTIAVLWSLVRYRWRRL